MQSYEGITVEEHITTDGPLRRRVTYARPWRVRVETLAPPPTPASSSSTTAPSW
jgi:hypothetical protein